MIKRSIRQYIKKKLKEPQVKGSACGLGYIFLFICYKFMGKSSSYGYVTL